MRKLNDDAPGETRRATFRLGQAREEALDRIAVAFGVPGRSAALRELIDRQIARLDRGKKSGK